MSIEDSRRCRRWHLRALAKRGEEKKEQGKKKTTSTNRGEKRIMCIIAIKQRGVKFPSINRVETMCRNNPDGFAISYNTDNGGEGHSYVYRTMNKKDFINFYRTLIKKYDYRTTALYLHARIATHGSLRKENCHAFTDNDTHISFAHNGILPIPNRGDMTDSETFFRDYFLPTYKHGGWGEAAAVIKDIIGYSKFVFMDDRGEITIFGSYIEDADGILYSNSSYEDSYNNYYYNKRKFRFFEG